MTTLEHANRSPCNTINIYLEMLYDAKCNALPSYGTAIANWGQHDQSVKRSTDDMKLFLQAVQAVTVEFVGVLLVVWLLFGFASWGLRKAAGDRSGWDRQFVAVVESWGTRENSIRAAEASPDPQRTQYVAGRLDYYSQVFGNASRNILRDNWQLDL